MMNGSPLHDSNTEMPLTALQWIGRVMVIAIELILAFWCSVGGDLFYYQGF